MFLPAIIPSAMPNLHPLVVHFPVALALTALLFRLLLVFKPARPQLEWSATALTILAALGGAAAWLAGKQAAGNLGAISMAAESTLSRHANLAGVTVLLLAAAAVLAIIHNLTRGAARAPSRRTAGSAFVVLLLAVGFMSVTADLGGSLVYRYGVAVAEPREIAPAVGEPASADTTAKTVVAGPVQDWDPAAGPAVDYHVDGSGLILLPNTYDDVAVTAVVNPRNFTGDLAVVHHTQAVDNWEGFRLTAGNKAQLVKVGNKGEEILKGTSLLFPDEATNLRVTATQGHFKGLIDGDMVVHGHAPSGAPGRVGLFYSGQGTLRVLSISAETAQEH